MAPKRDRNKPQAVQPPRTLAEIFGTPKPAEQVERALGVLSELVQRQQSREIAVSLTLNVYSGKLRLLISEDATYDEALTALEKAQRAIVEARYKAGLEQHAPERDLQAEVDQAKKELAEAQRDAQAALQQLGR
jgi:predicted nucleic acid-binding protein